MDVLEKLALRSRRLGWLSLFGALLVFISIGYSYFTIQQLDEEVAHRNSEIENLQNEITRLKSEVTRLEDEIENKKNYIKNLVVSIDKLNEQRKSAAALLLDILNIEHQVRVDSAVNWNDFRNQLFSMPPGKRQEAILTAILLAWKDVPFNIKGRRLLEGFSSTSFIQYVLRRFDINVQENRGEYTSDALMRSFEETEHTEPGDIACFRGNIGNFCLLIINTSAEGKPLAGIGTLETANPLGIYAISSINVRSYPLIGYFKVPYKG